MKYFTIKELTRTSAPFDNTPTADVEVALTNLVDNLLDHIRESLGKPIHVNSGYRSPQVNIAVGGVATSQHTKGEAADIELGSKTKEENMVLFQAIANSGLDFDQLIDEKDYSWVHVSLKKSGVNRKQILHLP